MTGMEPPDIPYPPPDTPFMPMHPAWKPGARSPSLFRLDFRSPESKDQGKDASEDAWLLTVCDVPAVPRYLDLVKKLGFTRSRRCLDNWCYRFEPWQEDRKERAREIVAQLKLGGLPSRFWMKVASKRGTAAG